MTPPGRSTSDRLGTVSSNTGYCGGNLCAPLLLAGPRQIGDDENGDADADGNVRDIENRITPDLLPVEVQKRFGVRC